MVPRPPCSAPVTKKGSTLQVTRIGILGNDVVQNDCSQCDSRIGFGTGGNHDDNNTCGNEAGGGDKGAKHIKAMGFIFVN